MTIATIPNAINPGDPVAAGPVMANFNYLAGRMNSASCVVAQKNSGVQTFTTSASKVAFNTAAVDLAGEFDTTLFRFTAKAAGVFWVHCEMFLDNASTQSVSLLLYKSGIAPTSSGIQSVTSLITVVTQSVRFSGLIQLAVADYLEVFCATNTGSVTTDASGGNRFDILQVR